MHCTKVKTKCLVERQFSANSQECVRHVYTDGSNQIFSVSMDLFPTIHYIVRLIMTGGQIHYSENIQLFKLIYIKHYKLLYIFLIAGLIHSSYVLLSCISSIFLSSRVACAFLSCTPYHPSHIFTDFGHVSQSSCHFYYDIPNSFPRHVRSIIHQSVYEFFILFAFHECSHVMAKLHMVIAASV